MGQGTHAWVLELDTRERLAIAREAMAEGYADVVCIVAALASPPESSKYNKSMATTEVSKKAADWLKTQRIMIKR